MSGFPGWSPWLATFPDNPPQHSTATPAAVLVPILWHQNGLHVLFTQRPANLIHHGGQICFPGGRLEPEEQVLEGALRETREEIGIPPSHWQILGFGPGRHTTSNFWVNPVVAYLDHWPSMLLSCQEVAGVFSVPWDHVVHALVHRCWQLKKQRYDAFSLAWQQHIVWGLTAAILADLKRCVHLRN